MCNQGPTPQRPDGSVALFTAGGLSAADGRDAATDGNQ